MKRPNVSPYLLLLIVSILWGFAGPIIKYTLQYFQPDIFLAYRFFLNTILAIGYFALFPSFLPKTKKQRVSVIQYSILTVVIGLGLLFLGFELTNSLTAILLASTGPVFSILFGAMLLREHVTVQEIIGISLAIIGSILTAITSDTSPHEGLLGIAMIGNLLIILSRVADALGGVSAKHALQAGMRPIALPHLSFAVGFIIFFIIAVGRFGGILPVVNAVLSAPFQGHLGVFYMAFISGTVAYTLYTNAIKRIEIGNASIFSYLTVIWGAPLAVLWLGDMITPQFIFGSMIIAVGVTLAEWKRHKERKKRKNKKR